MPVNPTEITIYIGEDIYDKLSDEEKETFETTDRYKPDAIAEQIEEADAADESWKDPFGPFKDLDDYEDFWGADWSSTGGRVYEKYFNEEDGWLSEEDKARFQKLSQKVKEDGWGNQLRITQIVKLSFIARYDASEGIKIHSDYIEEFQLNEEIVFSVKIGLKSIRLVKWEEDSPPVKSLHDANGKLTYEVYADSDGDYLIDKEYLEIIETEDGQEYEIELQDEIGIRLIPMSDDDDGW